MNNLDERISQALQHHESDLTTTERPFLDEIAGAFRGRNRWLTVAVYIYIFLFLGIAIWTMILFFRTDSTRYMILWASTAICCVLSIGHLKIWLWMLMNRNAVLREVKRLELAVTLMAEGLERREAEGGD